jgi:hypothetical protein
MSPFVMSLIAEKAALKAAFILTVIAGATGTYMAIPIERLRLETETGDTGEVKTIPSEGASSNHRFHRAVLRHPSPISGLIERFLDEVRERGRR